MLSNASFGGPSGSRSSNNLLNRSSSLSPVERWSFGRGIVWTCWTKADVGNVRICVTETSSSTWPVFCMFVVLLVGACVPRISPSSNDSGRMVNEGWVSIEIKHAERITGWSWQRRMWHIGHESRINAAQRTRFFFERIIPQPKSDVDHYCREDLKSRNLLFNSPCPSRPKRPMTILHGIVVVATIRMMKSQSFFKPTRRACWTFRRCLKRWSRCNLSLSQSSTSEWSYRSGTSMLIEQVSKSSPRSSEHDTNRYRWSSDKQ